jgi:hypothetical protein
MSFNVWYADLLTTGVLDPRVPILGLARDAWGTLLLATGVAAAYALARCWERRNPARADLAMLPLAALVMLAAILLPTRVHSTYGAFTAPFLIATAFLIPLLPRACSPPRIFTRRERPGRRSPTG